MGFPFVTAKLRRVGDLHLEQGLPISHGNHIQTVLSKKGAVGFFLCFFVSRTWGAAFRAGGTYPN